jgi:hypothetical protein
MTLNNSMSITPMPPAKAKGARFEHGSVLGGKTRAARVSSQWKSTGARPLDRGKPRDEDTEGGRQPADKSLINRRLSLHSQPCAAMAFLADGELAEQALNHASPLDREHKKLAAHRPCPIVSIAF